MSTDINVRWGWLKGMYIYTIAGAGAFGLGILIMPETMCKIFGWPNQDQAIGFGVAGSVYTSFAILSIFGLKSPLKFLPVLLLQMCYKTVWFIGVIMPLLLTGRFESYMVLYAVIYATYIIGDIIAIPFPYLLARQGTEGAVGGEVRAEA